MSINESVSIIVPVYNLEQYIERCVDSLLIQDYTDIEILLVNDGSTDHSLEILKKYTEKSEKIIVINKENGGVSSARNAGIDQAKGYYLVFVDGDDYVDPDFISTMVNGYRKGIQLSMVGYRVVEQNGKVKEINRVFCKDSFSRVELLNKLYDEKLYAGYSCNKCFLSNVIKEYGIRFDENIRILEDLLFCVEYMIHIDRGVYNSEAKYSYCMRSGSAVNTDNSIRDKTQLIALEKILRIAEKCNCEFKQLTTNRFVNLALAVYYSGNCFSRYERTSVCDFGKKIAELKGELTTKHKVMLFFMRRTPYISYIVSRIHKLKWS